MTMCMPSWMDAKILKMPANRAAVVAVIASANKEDFTNKIEDFVNQLNIEEEN